GRRRRQGGGRRRRPRPNLTGQGGFMFRRASHIQIHAKTGARRTMNVELTTCQYPDGKLQPKIRFCEYLRAKTLKVDPAWSKIEKKKMAPKKSARMANMRLRSAAFHWATVNIA